MIFISKLNKEGDYDKNLQEKTKIIRTKVVDNLLISKLCPDNKYDKILAEIIKEASLNEYTRWEIMFSDEHTINRGVLFGTGYKQIAEKIKSLIDSHNDNDLKSFKKKYQNFTDEMFVLNFFEQSSLTKEHQMEFVRPELDLAYYFHEFSDQQSTEFSKLEDFKSEFENFLKEHPNNKNLTTILGNHNDFIEKFLDETTTSQDYFITGSNYFNTKTKEGRKTVLKLNELQKLKEGKKSSPFEGAVISSSYPFNGNVVEELNRQGPDIMAKLGHFFTPFDNDIKHRFSEGAECVGNYFGNYFWNHASTNFHEAVSKIPSLQQDVSREGEIIAGIAKLAITRDDDVAQTHATEGIGAKSSLPHLFQSAVGKLPIPEHGDQVFLPIIDTVAPFIGPVAFGAKIGTDVADAILEYRDKGRDNDEKYTSGEKFTRRIGVGILGALAGGAFATGAFTAPVAAIAAPVAAAGVVGYTVGQLIFDLNERRQENHNDENAKRTRLLAGARGALVGGGLAATVLFGATALGGAAALGVAGAVATPVIAGIGLVALTTRVVMLVQGFKDSELAKQIPENNVTPIGESKKLDEEEELSL